MPSEGRRLHGFTVVSGSLRLARQLILPAILGGASAGDDLATTLQWVALILSVPSIILAVAQWLAFRFRLEGDELIIDSGVLSRRRRVIPLARIQNVDLERTALERLAGVAELRMETASGSGETEASLAVLSLDEARALQAELMRRRAEARAAARGEGVAGLEGEAPTPDGPPPVRVLHRIPTLDLALAGATSNEAGLIAAGLATGLELLDDVAGLDRVERWLETVFASGAEAGVVGVVAFIAGLVLVLVVTGWALSVGVSVIRFHGFTLSRAGDDIRREYGLLSRHHSTVPLERVQAVRIEETLLRRPLGLVALKIETAGAGPQQRQQGGARSEAFVPIARRRDVGRLLREVFPDARFQGTDLQPVSPLARRRVFLRLAVPVLLAAGALAALVDGEWAFLLALLLPAWLYAGAAYRARGWARPRGYALLRGGVITRVSWVIPERKIQTLHVVDTPFQRRLGLRTLLVDTAAGGRVARVADLGRDTAVPLLLEMARGAEAARRGAGPSDPAPDQGPGPPPGGPPGLRGAPPAPR